MATITEIPTDNSAEVRKALSAKIKRERSWTDWILTVILWVVYAALSVLVLCLAFRGVKSLYRRYNNTSNTEAPSNDNVQGEGNGIPAGNAQNVTPADGSGNQTSSSVGNPTQTNSQSST